MGHHCCSKQKVRRGLWSPEEDEKLARYIASHGYSCWSSVPKQAGLQRCGKSCRLRWINYLRPDLKRGSFTAQEERIIIDVHRILGNRWAQIAKHLPGRTDNEVKNFWNSSIKKKLMAQGLDPTTHNLMKTPAAATCSTSNTSSATSSHNVSPAPFTISNSCNTMIGKSNKSTKNSTTMPTRDILIEDYYKDSGGASYVSDPPVDVPTGPHMYSSVTTTDAIAPPRNFNAHLTFSDQPSISTKAMTCSTMSIICSPTQENDQEMLPNGNSHPAFQHVPFESIVGEDPSWISTIGIADMSEASGGGNLINVEALPGRSCEESDTPMDFDVAFSNLGLQYPMSTEFDLLHGENDLNQIRWDG